MRLISRFALSLALATSAAAAIAADEPATKKGDDQVVVPQVERRDVRVPKIPSRDFEVGAFFGVYNMQGFSASGVGGLRLGYHINEDVFVEGVLGSTRVSDDVYKQIFSGQVLQDNKLSYYNVSLGWNLMPGEVFFGRTSARASAVYLIGGVGSTKFNQRTHQTINLGVGTRVFLRDWAAVQVDVRDHMFSDDLLGQRRNNHNVEFTGGVTFFF